MVLSQEHPTGSNARRENLLQPALKAERRHSVLWLAWVQGQIAPFSAAVYRCRGGLHVHRYVKRAWLMSCYPREADRKPRQALLL